MALEKHQQKMRYCLIYDNCKVVQILVLRNYCCYSQAALVRISLICREACYMTPIVACRCHYIGSGAGGAQPADTRSDQDLRGAPGAPPAL